MAVKVLPKRLSENKEFLDRFYREGRAAARLNHSNIVQAIDGLKVYRWVFYKSPEVLRGFREESYRRFLADYDSGRGKRYVFGRLPTLPFAEDRFQLALVSYLLFVYEDQLSYEFHKQSIREIMRVTSGEARIYPLVTFEAKRSQYLDPLRDDPDLRHLRFALVPTDFEFLANSNTYMSIRQSL